jgi:hypothetical protein
MDTKRISAVSGTVLFALTATASAGPMSFTSSKHIAPPQTQTEPVYYRYYGGYGGWNRGAAIAGAAIGLLTLGAVAATAGSPYYGYGYPSYGWGYTYPSYGWGYGYPTYGSYAYYDPRYRPYGSYAYYGRPYGYYGGSYSYGYPYHRNYGYYNYPRYRHYGYYGHQNYRHYGYRQGRHYVYKGGIHTGRSVGYGHMRHGWRQR